MKNPIAPEILAHLPSTAVLLRVDGTVETVKELVAKNAMDLGSEVNAGEVDGRDE